MVDREAMCWALLEAAPDSIVAVDRSGRIVMANARTGALFGYSRDELVGQPVEVLVPEADRAVHRAHRDRYFARPVPRPMGAGMELAGRRRDGTTFLAEISLSSIDTDDGLIVSAAIRDVSDRVQTAIVSSSSDAIISKDLSGTVRSWNRGAEKLFGYRASEIIGRNVEILVPAERIDEERMLLSRAASGEIVSEHETKRRRADGTLVDVSLSMSPIVGTYGATGVSTITRDISDRVRLDEERRTLAKRLHRSERLESLGKLAGGVAHDFNNLLSVILNYTDFLGDAVADDAEATADLAQIRYAADRAARLTHELLIFGQGDPVQRETFDLNSVINDVELLLSRAIGNHIDMSSRLSPGPALITADRSKIEQVLVNLAVNARDAMPEGGRLQITTATVTLPASDPPEEDGTEPGPYVVLTVTDTGTGMDESTAQHIFEPFFTTKPRGEGSGLGLATVYGIVTDLGGSVRVESAPGTGTAFIVHLPEAQQPPDAEVTHERPARPGPQPQGQTVLVVDDEDAVRGVVTRILDRNGYQVVQASRGAEALAIAETTALDAVVTDVIMPEMSGPQLAELLWQGRPDLPVLLMTGYSEGQVGPSRQDATFEVLQKPFTETSLIERLHGILAKPSGDRPPVDGGPGT